ncbi:MAG: hypothetical protein R3F61_23020 [Myxococcota bacterium]
MARPTAESLLAEGFGSWAFCRHAQKADPSVIRALMAVPLDVGSPQSVFVHALVDVELDDDGLVERWRSALQGLLDLQVTYAWGSAKRRAKLVGIATDPAKLGAVQAACARCELVPIDFLAVLALDASEPSEDAFLPHLERARVRNDGLLDTLERLRKHVKPGSGIARLLDRVDEALDRREAASPALVYAEHFGVRNATTFWFRLGFGSVELTGGGVPRIQAHLVVDSSSSEWFALHVTGIEEGLRFATTSVTADGIKRDALGLGPCDPDRVPDYLKAAAETLGIEWNAAHPHLSASVRGRKRDRIATWAFQRL